MSVKSIQLKRLQLLNFEGVLLSDLLFIIMALILKKTSKHAFDFNYRNAHSHRE